VVVIKQKQRRLPSPLFSQKKVEQVKPHWKKKEKPGDNDNGLKHLNGDLMRVLTSRVGELRDECKEKSLSSVGTKAELLHRLLTYYDKQKEEND
jgi:hypothetical protein